MLGIQRDPNLVLPIVTFLLAFFVALHVTWLLRWATGRLGILDHPSVRKLQERPVPSMGGVAIVGAVALSVAVAYFLADELGLPWTREIAVILGVGVGIAVVGALDDIFSVSAQVKLCVLAAACLVLALHGIGLNRTPSVVLNFLLTFLWVAGVSSAFNAIDNADGLAGGVCLISALAMFVLGWSSWQIGFSFLAMALAGSVTGFLHHNVRPARIYMGDCGSFFLGYILAVLVIFGEWSGNGWRAFVAGCFILAFPLFDLSMTTLLRIRHGIVSNPIDAIVHCDLDHTSHRLRKLGLSHGRMIAVCCAICVACCSLALGVIRLSAPLAVLCAVVGACALAAFGAFLDWRTSGLGVWRNTGRESGEAAGARPGK